MLIWTVKVCCAETKGIISFLFDYILKDWFMASFVSHSFW